MIARLSAITALAAAGLLLASTPIQAATAPGEVGLASTLSVTVTATSSGWSHTISGMAAHVCGRSTPALWATIARVNGVAAPDRAAGSRRWCQQVISVSCST